MLHARPDYQDRIQDADGLIPDDEPVFILRAQDKTASAVVRFWAALNVNGDPIAVQMAQDHADKMDRWPKKKTADVPHTARQVAQVISEQL